MTRVARREREEQILVREQHSEGNNECYIIAGEFYY